MKSAQLLLVLVLLSLASFAGTLRVPQDFPTVQDAVAASVAGDSIVISPGLYAIPAAPCTLANGAQHTCGLVLHNGTALIGSGPAQTVLDFSGAEIGILLQNGTATAKLFHLQNANTTLFAYVGSNITAKNIIITNSNLGLELNQGNSYTVINTTIDGSHDSTQTGSAIDVPFGGVANIQNNLVTNNDRGFTAGSFSGGTYAYNDVFGSTIADWSTCNANGCTAVSAPASNISSDPLYGLDFTLQSSSPARNAGNPAILNPDGTRSDMGAYGGPEAIFPSTTPCANDGGDTDGDGLCDNWEKFGLTVNVNGNPVFVNLPSMGADPNHKDIFVQADYMVDPGLCLPIIGCFFGHTHTTSFVEHGTAGRVIRRKTMTTAAAATHPYSSSIIQPGTSHGRPSVRKCQT